MVAPDVEHKVVAPDVEHEVVAPDVEHEVVAPDVEHEASGLSQLVMTQALRMLPHL